MQNFRITAQSDRRNCRDNAGCIFTGAVHRTMAVSAVGESAERNRFAERESGCDLDLAGRRFDNRDTFGTLPGFLQHLVRSGARSERRFRAYPERTPFAHGTDIGTVRDIDHIDHRHAVDTRTKPLHAKIRYGVPT